MRVRTAAGGAVVVVVVLLLCGTVSAQHSHGSTHSGNAATGHPGGYAVGQRFKLQCKDRNGKWGPAPKCLESKEEMTFQFGTDSLMFCGWKVENKEDYEYFKSLVEAKERWDCRVPMAPDQKFWLPMPLPLWGVVETGHFHVNNHMNFLFHADHGRIIGVAAYPVRDVFQFVQVGSAINIHGPVRWVQRHSLISFASGQQAPAAGLSGRGSIMATLAWCFITMLLTSAGFVGLYYRYLKPKLVKKYLKRD